MTDIDSKKKQTFKALPDASKVTFISVPAIDLTSLLPNLPPSTVPQSDPSSSRQSTATSHSPPSIQAPSPFDLLHRFLVYPPPDRIRAKDALRHPWFTAADPLVLLPANYLAAGAIDEGVNHVSFIWEGKTLEEWLRMSLPQRSAVKAD